MRSRHWQVCSKHTADVVQRARHGAPGPALLCTCPPVHPTPPPLAHRTPLRRACSPPPPRARGWSWTGRRGRRTERGGEGWGWGGVGGGVGGGSGRQERAAVGPGRAVLLTRLHAAAVACSRPALGTLSPARSAAGPLPLPAAPPARFPRPPTSIQLSSLASLAATTRENTLRPSTCAATARRVASRGPDACWMTPLRPRRQPRQQEPHQQELQAPLGCLAQHHPPCRCGRTRPASCA